MENQFCMAGELKIAKAKEDGKRIFAERRARGDPFHRPPQGLATNKQKNGDVKSTE